MELLKREVSLTLLKVRLLDASASSAPASGDDSSANQTLTPNQRIFCELQVTGNAEERGLVAPTTQAAHRAPSRKKRSSSRPTYEACENDTSSSLTRTLAQWSFATEEMQLPVDYSAALRFRDKPSFAGGWLADMAHFAVSRFLSEIRADTLERFASAARWLPSGKPTLPSTMMRQLQTLLPSILREGDSLWLELAEPTGYLPLLPWEEMLRPVTSVPILRLSPHAVQALSPDRELSVVLCLSVPSDKWTPTPEQLALLVGAIRGALPGRSTVHVFADDLCHPVFVAAHRQMETDDARGRVIRLYDLPGKVSDKEQRDEWWRAWVAESLAGRAADIVHWVAPGMLFADHARLVISRDLDLGEELDKTRSQAARAMGRPLRYITPIELCDSLTHLGAWAAVFSAPSQGNRPDQARMGLRLLVDQIGRLRPGVVAFHDFEADPDCKALADTYEFMIGDPSIKASTSPSISVYCHPARAAAVASQPMSIPRELMQQYLKVEATIQAAIARDGSLPAWVASTQRIVEQAVSRAASQDGKDDEAVMRGLASALKYVEQILAEAVPASASGEGTSAGTRGAGTTSA